MDWVDCGQMDRKKNRSKETWVEIMADLMSQREKRES